MPWATRSRRLFGPEKPFVKSRPAYSVKLIFSHVVNGIKIKITAKFRASRRVRFEDKMRVSPEIRPKSFGTSRKSRRIFGPEKPFVKLRPAHSVKLVFSYVIKEIKIKIGAKFRASRFLGFEDTKRTMSPEIRPKSLGTFKKRAPVGQSLVGWRYCRLRWMQLKKLRFKTPTTEYTHWCV